MARALAATLFLLSLAGCGDDGSVASARPVPREPGPEAVGTLCGMFLSEHAGPKGQVFLWGQDQPLWFSSVRDTFAWLLIDEEGGKEFAAIYVNDMARATRWAAPEVGTWIEARRAYYVIGSDKGAAMGSSELVPFSDPGRADEFAGRHGGRVVTFQQITPATLK